MTAQIRSWKEKLQVCVFEPETCRSQDLWPNSGYDRPKDEDAYYENTRWINRDLIPMPQERRTFDVLSYAGTALISCFGQRVRILTWSYLGYWTVTGVNVSSWSVGSGLLALGLSPREAIGVVVGPHDPDPHGKVASSSDSQVIGSVLTGLLAVAGGWVGEKQHIGFTVATRFSWGMNGSYFPVLLRVFIGSMWLGLQAYWGGQSLRVLIGAIIPGAYHR
jgi:nucleobase:cation symporter-1, NCS1 family